MDWSTLSGCLDQGYAHLSCLPAVFKNIINACLFLAGTITVIFIIIAAYHLVTSNGNQERVSKARKTLTYAFIGLIVVLLSFFIVNFVGVITGTQNCINQIGFTQCQ